jgi:RNA-binding protein YlmH
MIKQKESLINRKFIAQILHMNKSKKEKKLRKILVKEDSATRLDKIIATKCEDLSRTMIQKLIQDEKIFVNGKPR